MSPDEIARLVAAAGRAGVAEIEVEAGGTSLRLRMAVPPPSAVPSGVEGPSEDRPVAASPRPERGIRAPAVGVFHARHPATGKAPVAAGDTVETGRVVAYLQVGPCLRPVVAGQAGTIGEPLLPDGTIVGYGAPLYELT